MTGAAHEQTVVELSWYIELKCPGCSGRRWSRFDVEMLDALDRELARAEDEIEADLARVTRPTWLTT